MPQKANLINLKYIIAILSTVVIGMSVYIVNDKFQKKDTYSTILEKNDAKSLLTDLEFLKGKYDQTISDNINLSDEVIEEREKVQQLINEIKSKKLTIKEYNDKLLDIKSKMIFLFDENFKLRKNLVSQPVPVNTLVEIPTNIKEIQERNKFLEKKNEELNETIKKASKLTFLNLNATSYKAKNSGKLVATQNCKRANFLVVNYTINQNQFAKPGQKTLYFQIIDPENKVVGETKATTISEKALLYTFVAKIAYHNKTEDFSQQLPFSSFSKGNYQVNIYDENSLLAETTFEMK
ncbi:MAG: hypothetical protein O9267_13000 [Flavobacterium sp.]|uniref:hypothetical protein n=1 Tax=Flavobacterium sp. TaxID=239 RepID=UPI0022BDA5A2|nr:hypothetical protein [Flavobacterium sp.]MCZ8198516.1 hypothetical protein [Flavobacterium sp.]